jgi:signal transduction histidine kinase
MSTPGRHQHRELLTVIARTALAAAGAQRGVLLLERKGQWEIEAEARSDESPIEVMPGLSLSAAIVNQVASSRQEVLLNDATRQGPYTEDPYILARQPRSVLCLPLRGRETLSGILYLENHLTPGAFTPERVAVLKLLSSQSGLSLETARLYEKQEQYLHTLEAQLMAQEKLASLGMLTAGIAHEIKNPLNFVTNFARIAVELVGELSEQLDVRRARMDEGTRGMFQDGLSELRVTAEKIESHGMRADKIIHDVLMLSRGQRGERRPTNINRLLEESARLVYHGMRGSNPGFTLSLLMDLDESIEPIEVFPSELGRAFMNIIHNACYAVSKKRETAGAGFNPTLSLSTRKSGDRVEVGIRDNGTGIPLDVRDKLFMPFFTTKPVNEGTGLGLSITHEILVAEHGGSIEVDSREGEYTHFSISLPRS